MNRRLPWLVKDGKTVLGTVHTADIDLALSAARNRWPRVARWLTVTNYKQPGHTERWEPSRCQCGHLLGGKLAPDVEAELRTATVKCGV